ncbi:7-carboxy-7-deazaguanine synthase [Gammaproteobacteria bacterium]
MKYSEIFYSLQGEGIFVGMPSVFFRTSYCNLRCGWCDTPYTSWQPENKEITVDEVITGVNKFNVKHIVITGGEPCIQAAHLVELCQKLHDQKHHLTVETNGTAFVAIKADLISLSPKLANSTPDNDRIWTVRHEQERINLAALRQFLDTYDCQIKFVVDTPQDLTEIEKLVEQLNIPSCLVILMPQGITEERIKQKQSWLAEMCKKYGYRYSPRLHINIWGERRGI